MAKEPQIQVEKIQARIDGLKRKRERKLAKADQELDKSNREAAGRHNKTYKEVMKESIQNLGIDRTAQSCGKGSAAHQQLAASCAGARGAAAGQGGCFACRRTRPAGQAGRIRRIRVARPPSPPSISHALAGSGTALISMPAPAVLVARANLPPPPAATSSPSAASPAGVLGWPLTEGASSDVGEAASMASQ